VCSLCFNLIWLLWLSVLAVFQHVMWMASGCPQPKAHPVSSLATGSCNSHLQCRPGEDYSTSSSGAVIRPFTRERREVGIYNRNSQSSLSSVQRLGIRRPSGALAVVFHDVRLRVYIGHHLVLQLGLLFVSGSESNSLCSLQT